MTYSRLGDSTLVPVRHTAGKPDPGILTKRYGRTTVTMYDTALAQSAYGRPKGITPRLKRKDSPIRVLKPKGNGAAPLSVTLYDTALTMDAYGKPAMLGDLFGDVMGAVIGKQNWDARPDWMKKIQVKPDPAKLLQAASKIVPPSQVGRVLDQAQGAGINLFYQTPAGNVPVTSQTAGALYSGYPVFSQAKSAIENVPIWGWVLGGGAVLLLVMGMMRK